MSWTAFIQYRLLADVIQFIELVIKGGIMRVLMTAIILLLGACSDRENSVEEFRPSNTPLNQNVIAPESAVVASASPATETLTISPASSPVSSNSGQNTNHLGVSSLGMSFEKLLSHYEYDSTDEDGDYYWVSKDGELLFGLNDKNWLKDKVVWMIAIRSPIITSDGDVHVGMSVGELLEKFPNLSLDTDEDGSDFYAPPELEKGTPDNPDARIFFYISEGAVDNILVFVSGNRPLLSAKPPLSK